MAGSALWGIRACALALFCSVPSWASSPIPPAKRIAPIGWETRITPGFYPPVEYAVVYEFTSHHGMTAEAAKRTVEAWGPDCFNVLQKLAEDPAWKAYLGVIEGLISEIRTPEAIAYFRSAAKAALSAPESSDDATRNVMQSLNRLRRVSPNDFEQLFEEALPTASPSARISLIQVFASSLFDDAQADACAERLQAILNESQDPKERELITRYLDDLVTRRRGDEPMQRILDIERGKGQP